MGASSFSAAIIMEEGKGGWTYVVWPESAEFLGTRKAVKVAAKIEDHEFNATFLPVGDGTHMLPLSKTVIKAIGKSGGDTVAVEVRTLK